MPLYEFECDNCGNRRDAIVKFGVVVDCDVCNQPMRMLVSKAGFALEGGGWAKEGYTK